MRFIKALFILLLLLSVAAALVYVVFYRSSAPPLSQVYEVETPSSKNLKQVISATGKLKLKDLVKVGSVVAGRIKAIHVEENDVVKEGQLLVEIETEFGDTEVREAQGAYERAMADLEFYEIAFKRKKQLFDEQYISDVELEDAKRHYLSTLADIKTLKATYEKKVIAFESSKVYAPTAGIVIHLDVGKGEKVSSDLDGGELLSIAPDIHRIEAELDISEKDIGQIEKGQSVQLVVDTYPNRVFKSTIHNISFISKSEDDAECVYQAKAFVDNPRFLLRPGMSVNATVDVAEVDSALTVTSRVFLIKQDHLQAASLLLNLPIHPFDQEEKEALYQSNSDENIQFIWADCTDCFREIPVKIGITDNISFEVLSGLKGDEKMVVDIMEDDEMQKIYDKIYRKL